MEAMIRNCAPGLGGPTRDAVLRAFQVVAPHLVGEARAKRNKTELCAFIADSDLDKPYRKQGDDVQKRKDVIGRTETISESKTSIEAVLRPIEAKCVLSNTIIPPTCLRDYHVKHLLGKGMYGSVCDACVGSPGDDTSPGEDSSPGDKSCGYVVKITVIKPTDKPELPVTLNTNSRAMLESKFAIENEVTTRAAAAGIAPRFYGAWICEAPVPSYPGYRLGFQVMERLASDLDKWAPAHKIAYKTHRAAFLAEAKKHLDVLHQLGITHNDVHSRNLMVRANEAGVPHLVVIDFGLSVVYSDPTSAEFEVAVAKDQSMLKEAFRQLDSEVLKRGTSSSSSSSKKNRPWTLRIKKKKVQYVTLKRPDTTNAAGTRQ
jgi:hypothetical protein